MSARIGQISGLPLSSQREFTFPPLEERKMVIRDVVASFNKNNFSLEFHPRVFESITLEQSERPNSEWTIIGDLEGTLMIWGVHDPRCWTVLNEMQPPKKRAILFAEKLQRRFEAELERYDQTSRPPSWESGPSIQTATRARSVVMDISERMRDLAAVAIFDLDTRPGDQTSRARILLSALDAIIARHTDISSTDSGGIQQTVGAQPKTSLCDSLIRRPPQDEPMFMLDALERVSPDAFTAVVDQVEMVRNRLQRANCPPPYQEAFRKLSARAGLI